jgi:tetratricopeptide repeat protein
VDRAGRWFGFLAVFCVLMGAEAGTARAAPVSPRELRARQDFAAGRYQEAVEIFAELYAKTADPIFLRNIARCYQKQNRADEAIANFREYLNKAKKLSPGEKEEVEGYIHELEASRAPLKTAEPAPLKTAEPAPAKTAEPVPPPRAAERAPAVTEAPREKTSATAPQPAARESTSAGADEPAPRRAGSEVATRTPSEESPPRTQIRTSAEPGGRGGVSVPGVALSIVGVAAIGGGVAFGLAARSAASAVASQYDPSRESAGKRDATLQWVGYGVGAAALVTGVILLVRGPGEREASPSSVQVGFGPGGASLSGRF